MEFDSEEEAYDFYNAHGGRIGFSIRKENGNKINGRITSRAYDKIKAKYVISKFVESHDHPFIIAECSHMMPFQRRISLVQAIHVELVSDLGVPACNTYVLMGRQSGGKESVGYLKVDLKNYLRTRRQNELLYGEVA
ncbi:uncharacterized protein LOC132316540 [Cornus florida]|uniref:uncharacterized protein LOC132316540 n=1 Tax=Cornus florida TaxID=4283 RepID=UPI00289E8F8F|nr:uncharacterized protein LOC132316540 [Cornus florida]